MQVVVLRRAVACAIWYCVSLFTMLRGHGGGAGTMNGFIRVMVVYVTGDMIMTMYLYAPLSSIHGTDTAFAFRCRTMLYSTANVGLPLIQVRSWFSK